MEIQHFCHYKISDYNIRLMAGKFTRKLYDQCALAQDTRQSTDPLELQMDITKYINCSNLCRPAGSAHPQGAQLVDVESSMWGLDKQASRCDAFKHPFCGPHGCLLTDDPRVPPHITPYACDWGHEGEPAVITTNMKMPSGPQYRVPNPNICNMQGNTPGNGYYAR
jgi:hypothetical protein